MKSSHHHLWNKINSFELDEAGIEFSFSDRLARENGWSKQYALRVIEEYKKFMFLCCVSPNSITPSDPVDQAWHLHLAYTKSYWIDLCRNTLEKEIHHHPTKGGKKEAFKFDGFYTGTHNTYRDVFGSEPPKDIWQDNHTRFTDIRFQRTNLNEFWLIKKPAKYLRQFFLVLGIMLFSILNIQAALNIGFYIFLIFIAFFGFIIFKSIGKSGGRSDSSATGCGSVGNHNNHHGDDGSGCSSGCSGCGGGD
ncbi:MAG: glycine-rich domain-containing protein [Chitinophagaceae bacterium]